MDMDNNTNVPVPKKSCTSTICLIFTLIIILCFGFLTYKLYKDKTDADDKIVALNRQINELKGNTSNLNDNVDSNATENNSSNSNSTSNNNTNTQCPACTASYSMTEVHRYVVSVVNGVPYIIPVYQNDGLNYDDYNFYFNHKFEVSDIKSGVKKAQSFNLGLDPSGVREYFIMEDGSVRLLEENLSKNSVTFKSKELASSSNKIESLEFTKGVVYGVSSSGSKIKIDEVPESIKSAFMG